MIRESASVKQTRKIAEEVAGTLRAGDCVALHGELGAGKTQFVQGLVRGLGGNERDVSSPTFVLLNVYHGKKLTVFHLDAYRTGGTEDFEGIGFAELLEQEGIVVVEWAEKVAGLLPVERVEVWIETVGQNRRSIRVQRRAAEGS